MDLKTSIKEVLQNQYPIMLIFSKEHQPGWHEATATNTENLVKVIRVQLRRQRHNTGQNNMFIILPSIVVEKESY